MKTNITLEDLVLMKNQKDLKVINTNILPMPLKATMAKNQKNTNILAYAVKSDDSRKTKEKTNILPMPLKAMMAKMKNTETRITY